MMMDFDKRKRELVQEFYPQVQSFGTLTKVWVAFLSLLVLIGIYALVIQIRDGQVVTGMRDNVVWGIYDINFIFFVTISYSGAFFTGVLHFYKNKWKNSVSRILEIVTMLSLIVGPIFILLCMGRLDRLQYLFMYPRIQSPITWDIIAIMTDIFGCMVYLYLTFIPDFAILRDQLRSDENVPKWRRKLYAVLAMNYRDTDEQRRLLHKTIRTMSGIVIALAIVAYTVIAWIFSLTLQPGWNSTIFAPYFIIAGLYSGVGFVIVVMYLFRRIYRLENYIKDVHFNIAGFVLTIFGILFGYFTFSEYFAKWFSHKAPDTVLLDTLFSRYYWEFIIANYIGVLFPFLLIFFKKLRSVTTISIAGALAVICLWLNRYLIVVPTLETPYIPIQETRPEYLFYTATWVEWALTFAGFAGFCLIFTLIVKFVPIIPMSGIIDYEREAAKESKLEPGEN